MKTKPKRLGCYFVYILECRDGSYYAGYTSNLEKRIKEHSGIKRGAKYLRGKLPVELAWSKEYKYRDCAMGVEYKIKQLTRLQKESLVNGRRLDRVFKDAEKRRSKANDIQTSL